MQPQRENSLAALRRDLALAVPAGSLTIPSAGHISLATNLAALEQLGPDWRELHAASAHPHGIFQSADWCLTCKVNEANAIDRVEVKKAFDAGGVVTMVGDWTNYDPAIARFLEAQGRSGVPLYLYYPKGAKEPQVLSQVLTPGTLPTLAWMSLVSWARRGHPAVVSATWTSTAPPSARGTPRSSIAMPWL